MERSNPGTSLAGWPYRPLHSGTLLFKIHIFRVPIVLALAYMAVEMAGGVPAVRAHDAPSGWVYPEECCQDTQDCQMIPARAVSTDALGFIVNLDPGEHRHAPDGGTFYILDNQVKKSGDEYYHVCIHVYTNGPGALCLYVPPNESAFLRERGSWQSGLAHNPLRAGVPRKASVSALARKMPVGS